MANESENEHEDRDDSDELSSDEAYDRVREAGRGELGEHDAFAAQSSAPLDERRAQGRTDEDEELPGASDVDTGTLGLERWVQFAFIVIAVTIMFLTDKIITLAWSYLAEPNSNVVLASAVILGILGGFGLYRHKQVRPLANDVAEELAKVTWPSRQETWYSTVVVIVASLIMASYLGAFDALWSAFTDLVYSV